MIVKNKSLYRKFIDWWDSWSHIGFWETSHRGPISTSPGAWIILIIIIFLAWYFDDVWRPFLHYYYPDYIPLLEYDPYTP
jgi:hypothetical protein|tara:strand:+ start:187 stop:426 length:240 start_codon:yes stop_codon:yes gene_type:complete